MKTLREIIREAEEKKVAVGHFNISNIEGVWAIFNAAKGLDLPIIIGVSEGERSFFGLKQIVAVVKSIREEFDYPIYINADHTYSIEKIKEAVDAGVDSIIIDGAKLGYDENLALTKEAVEYAKSVSASRRTDILVEGELGYIGSSSKVMDELPEGVTLDPDTLTTPEQAKKYVDETRVDLLAPAVGNVHGLLKGGNSNLDIERVKAIREACGVPLVLHGGSGTPDEDFVKAIKNGVAIVHINTEIRVAYRDAMKMSLQENPDEVAPYRIAKPAVQAMQKVVEARLKLFNS